MVALKLIVFGILGFIIGLTVSLAMSSNIFNHLKTILIHKWWVFIYCCKCGLIWRGIKHDFSKFSPTEFFESIKYYTGTRSPIDVCKEENGYSKAWQHHKGRNTHHYEHWTDNYDSGTIYIQMPVNDTIEMLCDYLGAARAYMGKNFSYEAELKWWDNIKKPTVNAMHPVIKYFISAVLYKLYISENNTIPWKLNRKDLIQIYNEEATKYSMLNITTKEEN